MTSPPIGPKQRPDRLIPFAAGVLPLANLAAWWLIRYNGGAQGHAWTIVAAILAVELLAIAVFAAFRTERAVVRSTLGALLLDVVVSAVIIYVFLFVFLAIGYSTRGGGD